MENKEIKTDNVGEEIRVTADTAEAEKEINAAAELGKFKSVDALLTAYKNLEAEFTRRSTRLKELEAGNKAQSMPEESAPSPEKDEREIVLEALKSEKVKEAVIAEYLKTLSENKSVPLISGGVSVRADKNTPQTVKEAGLLAQRFLKI